MGVGKSIMKEVVRDSKSSGSSAVCCGTIVDEMKKLLRSRSFAFEEVPKEGSEFFIMSLV
jgi:hypothetical protein